MNSKKNIFTTITIIMFIMFIAMIVSITLNLRDFGFDSAKTKAQLVAQSVKNGLTSHMVNGIMNNREFYINQTKELDNIDDLWIIRSKAVEKQYGVGTEFAKDEIDEKVLETGESIEYIDENFLGHSSYRITIPYKAEITKEINCLTCHEAKEGDILGAISIIITIDDLKQTSALIIFYTSLIALLLIATILLFIRRLTSPYFKIFDSIKIVMQNKSNVIVSSY